MEYSGAYMGNRFQDHNNIIKLEKEVKHLKQNVQLLTNYVCEQNILYEQNILNNKENKQEFDREVFRKANWNILGLLSGIGIGIISFVSYKKYYQ